MLIDLHIIIDVVINIVKNAYFSDETEVTLLEVRKSACSLRISISEETTETKAVIVLYKDNDNNQNTITSSYVTIREQNEDEQMVITDLLAHIQTDISNSIRMSLKGATYFVEDEDLL